MPTEFSQAGAIPYRIAHNAIEVLLISTSSGKNLTIPKGLIDPGFSTMETVHNEAMEEAGIKGELVMPAIGMYRFAKWGGICEVSVFVMMVTEMADRWPEATMRRRLWVAYQEAARKVKHRGLGRLILTVPQFIAAKGLLTPPG
jgi:8-oxo-dGTP pyrophosphatase MutT (NUDIX family)